MHALPIIVKVESPVCNSCHGCKHWIIIGYNCT